MPKTFIEKSFLKNIDIGLNAWTTQDLKRKKSKFNIYNSFLWQSPPWTFFPTLEAVHIIPTVSALPLFVLIIFCVNGLTTS